MEKRTSRVAFQVALVRCGEVVGISGETRAVLLFHRDRFPRQMVLFDFGSNNKVLSRVRKKKMQFCGAGYAAGQDMTANFARTIAGQEKTAKVAEEWREREGFQIQPEMTATTRYSSCPNQQIISDRAKLCKTNNLSVIGAIFRRGSRSALPRTDASSYGARWHEFAKELA